jgi:glycosyltransferase involved in cell wall biosynthesis
MNRYYADFAADYLAVDSEKIKIIRHGMNLRHFQNVKRSSDAGAPTIGFLARVCPDKGLHLLVDAAKELAKNRDAATFRIRAAGYLGQLNRPYLDEIVRRATTEPAIDFEYLGELDLAAKLRFLGSLDVMALPTVYRESKGISAMEALAVGTPIIVPNHGAFPELVADTCGGVLFEPKDAVSLAAALASHLDDRSAASARGRRGQAAIRERYTAERMARETVALYAQAFQSPLGHYDDP